MILEMISMINSQGMAMHLWQVPWTTAGLGILRVRWLTIDRCVGCKTWRWKNLFFIRVYDGIGVSPTTVNTKVNSSHAVSSVPRPPKKVISICRWTVSHPWMSLFDRFFQDQAPSWHISSSLVWKCHVVSWASLVESGWWESCSWKSKWSQSFFGCCRPPALLQEVNLWGKLGRARNVLHEQMWQRILWATKTL